MKTAYVESAHRTRWDVIDSLIVDESGRTKLLPDSGGQRQRGPPREITPVIYGFEQPHLRIVPTVPALPGLDLSEAGLDKYLRHNVSLNREFRSHRARHLLCPQDELEHVQHRKLKHSETTRT